MAPPVAGSWPWVQMITPSDIPPEIRKTLSGTEAVTAVDSGCTSDVAFVSTGNQAFALKRSREQPHRRWLAREYEVLTALMATRLPVPKPYLFVEDEGKSESWLLMDRRPGTEVARMISDLNDARRQEVFELVGAMARTLHQCPVPPGLTVQSSSEWLQSALSEADFNLRNYQVNGDAELRSRLRRDQPAPVESRLIHGDFNLENVLMTDDREVSIIDWSGGAVGDPRCDIALLLNDDVVEDIDESDRQAFFRGYGAAPVSAEALQYFVDLWEFF